VRDPWGSYCEYSHDIDYVPPEDFAVNFESPSNSLTRDLQLSEPV
jgi:hypothetical protein